MAWWDKPKGMRRGGGGLRFAGRTPSLQVRGLGGRVSRPPRSAESSASHRRQLAWTVAGACLLLSLLVALGRGLLGAAPSPEGVTVVGAPGFVPTAQLLSLPQGFMATFAALPVWIASLARENTLAGLVWLWVLTVALAAVWHFGARWSRLRRPQLALVALLGLHCWGAAFYYGQWVPSARRLRSTARVWAFGIRTDRSDGLLSPSAQMGRLRALGIHGVCFGDDTPLPSAVRAALQQSFPDVLLLNGAGKRLSPETSLLIVGPRRPVAATLETAVADARASRALSFLSLPDYETFHGGTNGALVRAASEARGLQRANPAQVWLGDANTERELRVWTLLPPQARVVGTTFALLRRGRVAVAFAEPERGAFGAAWNDLSRAQKLNVWLWIVALGAVAWLWGSRRAPDAEAPLGPGRALSFLRRRRLPLRLLGGGLMFGAFCCSSWAIAAGLHVPPARVTLSPGQVLAVWLACDVLFAGSLLLWRRQT